jgi:hypothetical protein
MNPFHRIQTVEEAQRAGRRIDLQIGTLLAMEPTPETMAARERLDALYDFAFARALQIFIARLEE